MSGRTRTSAPLGIGTDEDPDVNWSHSNVDFLGLFGRAIIEHDNLPRMVTDSSASILWSSPNAARMMRAPCPIYLENGRLCFEDGAATRDGEAFLNGLGRDRRRLLITSREHELWVLVTGWSEQVQGRRLLFLTCCLPQPATDCRKSGLADQFGLTRAEAAVLDQFASLRSPQQIAERLDVRLSTVRSHLKRLHVKLSVNASTKLLQIARAFGDS